ncbi:hypothetical protein P8C59_004433 [Phyllachora maydis]|uniref:Fringe-like glycosyltransferase domain-containing protein n=1 Tax=Phyllachora maydis TaxID=1825666 RepID=A0AAD9I298_9PEZI|nr:hypothetical protein P8C59_004433 [Phyllachora maydis]
MASQEAGAASQVESAPVPPRTNATDAHHVMVCDFDGDKLRLWQQKYELGDRFEYSKRYIKASRQDMERKSVTEVDQNFLADKARIVDPSKQNEPETCPAPLELPVTLSPFPSSANASDFIFGVSTTYKRFSSPVTSPINEWTYWLTDGKGRPNGGKLVLMLLDASETELEDAYDRLVAVGIDVDVYQSDASMEMAVRYLTLVPTLYTHAERRDRKWIVICDDDTFFPAFNALADRLADFDHTLPMYVGTLSEDVNSVDRHGSQAFGGAGVFLSAPLAKIVTERYGSCKTQQKIQESNSGWGPQGDILLRKCIYENTDTRLTSVNDLWQLDLLGDPSGFYEAGLRPLSLHHYRGGGWHLAHPWHYTKVAHLCGEDCHLQRFRFADGFVLANGYSLAHYPRGIDFDLGQVERTFRPATDDKGWNLDYALGPQRKTLAGTGRKMAWDLKEAVHNADGSVAQVYVRRADDARWTTPDGSPMSTLDGVVEVVWIS